MSRPLAALVLVAFSLITTTAHAQTDQTGHYTNSMVTPDAAQPVEAEPSRWLPIVRGQITVPRAAARAFVRATRASDSSQPTTTEPTVPPMPSLPEWTRCSSSWSQTLSLGEGGEQIWTFTTTMSDDDVHDLATSLRWDNDIATRHPQVARNYHQWLACNAAFVRDWRLHHSTIPPADLAGQLGYDSPLGTCHSTTPVSRRQTICSVKLEAVGCAAAGAYMRNGWPLGTPDADGKLRGWVIWAGDGLAYPGVISDPECLHGCSAEFDHPCSIPTQIVQPFSYVDTNGNHVATWWEGGDVSKPPVIGRNWLSEAQP